MQFDHRILANNIKYFRVKAGLSQDELGKKVHYSEMTIRRYELGKTIPSIEALFRLAEEFHCSADNLVKLDYENDDPHISQIRLPNATESDFYFFEGQSYYVYYLSEKASGRIKDGKLSFDKKYDSRRLYLHGVLDMHHLYDCKLVLENQDHAFIYGTGTEKAQRVLITLRFPDFGSDKILNPDIRYRGGLGIVVHKDTFGYQTAQNICLSYKRLDENDENTMRILLEFLTSENEIDRISINPKKDSSFCQWILSVDF